MYSNMTLMSFVIIYLVAMFYVCVGVVIPCIEYEGNCYSSVCCKPYICYEETVCINNTMIESK